MIGRSFSKIVLGVVLMSFTGLGGAIAGDRDQDRENRRDRADYHDDRRRDMRDDNRREHERREHAHREHDRRDYDRRDYDRRGYDHRGHDRHGYRGDYRGGRDIVVLDRGARHVITNYYGGYYREARGCPDGFKFKHGVCRPRGWAKQRYMIGEPLPRYVVVQPMPVMLVRDLPPPPRGHGYRYVDGDVLLVADATHRVVDAVVAVNAAINGSRY